MVRNSKSNSTENGTEMSAVNGTENSITILPNITENSLPNGKTDRVKAGALMSLGYSQSEVAKILRRSESTISEWVKRGEITIDSKALNTITEAIRAECLVNMGELVNISTRKLIDEVNNGEITGKTLSVTVGIMADKLIALFGALGTRNGTQNNTQVNISFEGVTDNRTVDIG